MAIPTDAPREYTIAELAQTTGITVRNIRAYRNRGLLAAPEKRGRLGIYSELHASRLRIITELLSRGYSIANIEELLKAWHQGQDIEGVLGLEAALFTPFSDAHTTHYNLADLSRQFGEALTPEVLLKAQELELLDPNGLQFKAPRPEMVEIGAALTELGFPLLTVLNILQDLRLHMEIAANNVVKIIEQDMFTGEPGTLPSADKSKELEDTIWKLRKLVNQAVISEMGRALDQAVSQRFGERMSRNLKNDQKHTAPP